MAEPHRLDASALAHWWRTVDRVLLATCGALLAIGVVLLLAAGPSAANRLGIENAFHFPMRQTAFLFPAIAIVVGVSMVSPLDARRIGVVAFIGALMTMAMLPLIANDVNGARRWVDLGGFAFQPSELLKPGFVIVAAWMLSEKRRNPAFPGIAIAMALYLVATALLVIQPDYGQAALLTAVWMVMFFISGWSILWILGIASAAGAALAFGFFFSDHLAARVRAFLDPTADGNYQVRQSVEAIASGGLGGAGDGPVIVKTRLPDAHTDFIFAVAGEQYGFFFCVLVIVLFAAFVMRALDKAAKAESAFAQVAIAGLGALIGLQAFINIGVSLRALPAKGMTLPFVSYGGSSLLTASLAVGLLLALTRRTRTIRRRREVMA
ncbi:MAG: cell division protein FtsW [Alphaproteobacteria bacterium]|nr:cell division protein FtsW [Alphaproteobacteria bacterium]